MTTAATPTTAIPPKIKNHLGEEPPTNIRMTPIIHTMMVADTWGSGMIRTANSPSTAINGTKPERKLFICSTRWEIIWANTTTTANFATSVGWNSTPRLIHRFTSFFVGAMALPRNTMTISSIRIARPQMGQASLWKWW